MKVELKDPRTPLRLKPEHERTMDRQINEVITKMHLSSVFIEEARNLSVEIGNRIADIGAELKIKSVGAPDESEADRTKRRAEVKELFAEADRYEAARRTPNQLAEEKRAEIKAQAIAVLQKFHDKHMGRRIAHLGTTCRLDGCDKQPRKGLRQVQHKGRKRTFVFCKEHAGVRNQIAKRDYQRLKSNSNLRVFAS